MRAFLAYFANSYYPNTIHPALTSFADECCGMLARLLAYVGMLALLAIVGVHVWDQLPDLADVEPLPAAGWSAASRLRPGFAVSLTDSPDKTQSYEILRHPGGGRKDVLRWGPSGVWPVAELEIYRAGRESDPAAPIATDVAARMDPEGRRELETAGIIESKFGPVTLLRLAGAPEGPRACLGFFRRHDDLRLSGWSCQGETLPARRAAISCMLDRLVLLTAGNDAKLADLFARAELKRAGCAAATSTIAADWVSAAQNPMLRGGL